MVESTPLQGPDMINDQEEQTLNFDFKISSWNEQIFIGWKPTYVDIKSPLDPEVLIIFYFLTTLS